MTRAMTKYNYDAFISYRHKELDKYAAELLHRQLEAFRLPGNLARKRKGERTRINRVFRDKDELPLTNNLEDPIMQALQASEFLIVICSPRLPESVWCRKEIETFISMHGRDKVLAVLIEGEPDESFPEELLYREETVTDADGSTHVERIPMEPLAADIRGKDKKAMKKALKTELLRLLAPMFSLNYDDLRQRHRERRLKRILAASLSVGAVCLAFGAVSTTMALRIQSQNVQIQAQADEILQQNEEIQQQSKEIQQQNQEITEKNEVLLNHQAVGLAEEAQRLLAAGDRIRAVATARDALTSYQGNEMPYTPEAYYALAESLHVYDNGTSAKPMHQMETAGIIYYMKLTPDGKTLMAYDNSQCFTIWDVASGSKLYEMRGVDIYTENSFTALGNDRIAYVNGDRYVDIYDIAAGEVVEELDYDRVGSIYADLEGKRIVLNRLKGLSILDGETYEQTDFLEKSGYYYGAGVSADGVFLALQEEIEDESRIVQLWNLETGEYYSLNTGKRSMQKILYRDDTAYVLLNEPASDYFSVASAVLAWDYQSGKILWEYNTDNYGSDIRLPYVEGASHLLLAVTFEAKLLNLEDGSEAESFPYGNSIVGTEAFWNNDYFMVFTQGGELHTINVNQMLDYYNTATLLSHSQNVKTFLVTEKGYLLLPYQDNRVTYYKRSIGEDIAPYEGEIPAPVAGQDDGIYADDLAEELGLVKAALATRFFYNEDRTKLFMIYSDNTIEIYQTSDMTLLNTLEETRGTQNQYLGTDKAGNMYIGGYASYGYMLDAQCRPLAVVEGLLGVDSENNRLILGWHEERYTVPIYTVEELLAKAE